MVRWVDLTGEATRLNPSKDHCKFYVEKYLGKDLYEIGDNRQGRRLDTNVNKRYKKYTIIQYMAKDNDRTCQIHFTEHIEKF